MCKRSIGIVLCIGLIAGILTGCHIPFLSKTEKERTMVFSHWDTENQKVYETLASKYMKKNKGLTIKIQEISREEYNETWLQSISDKNMADVFAVPAGKDFDVFAESGKLLDLDKVLPDDYDRSIIKLGTKDGHVWAVPVTGSVPVIFYNKALFQQYELVRPQTVSDFVVNCSILQHNGFTPFAMSKDENGFLDTADFVEGILANGSCDTDLVSEGKFFHKNEALDSGFHDVMGLAFEFALSDLMIPKEESVQGHQKLQEQFVNGACAMFPGSTNDISTLHKRNDQFEFGIFSMPGSKSFYKGVLKADMMLGISDKSKVDSDAEGFVRYLLSKEGQELLCNGVSRIPVTEKVPVSDPELAAAQGFLYTADGLSPSLYQRITEKERAICREKLDLAFSGSCGILEEYMLDWTNALKEVQ